MRWVLAALWVLFLSAPAMAQTAADPDRTRLDGRICIGARTAADLAREQVEYAAATSRIEASRKAQADALDAGAAGSEADDAALQHAYYRARFQALYPLAARGNSRAVFGLVTHYSYGESGIDDPAEWRRLVACASSMGNPDAMFELFKLTWHDRGDGSAGAVQANRAAALDLTARSARAGGLSSLEAVGVYILAGRHQYPISVPLGERVLSLCAQAGGDFCKDRLADALKVDDPVASYILLDQLAQTQPALYAMRRDAALVRLDAGQRVAVTAQRRDWTRTPWTALEPEWERVRGDVLAYGSGSVACPFGVTCPPPAAPP